METSWEGGRGKEGLEASGESKEETLGEEGGEGEGEGPA
jgi:hypothetical protein